MKFRKFLKSNREEKKLTQQQLIDFLSTFFEEFERLNTVSLGRWERGETVPSLKKMLLISSFFKINLSSFFKKNEVILSKTQMCKLDKYLKNMSAIGKNNSTIGYNSTYNGSYLFDCFSDINILVNKFKERELEKIYFHGLKIMGFELRGNFLTHFKQLEKKSNLKTLIYWFTNGGIHAHCALSFHDTQAIPHIISLYKSNKFEPKLLERSKNNDVLFVHVVVLSDLEWHQYVLREITKLVLNNNLKKILFNTQDKNAAIGLMSLFNGRLIATKKNKNYKIELTSRLIEIDAIDFISQHGIAKMAIDLTKKQSEYPPF